MSEKLLNYDLKEFKNYFPNTEIYKKLVKDHDVLYCNYKNDSIVYYDKDKLYRYEDGFFSREVDYCKTINVDIFHYIEYIMKENPKLVYDVGCGPNLLKKYYPNIIGFDPEHPNADFKSFFDDEFIDKNKNTADGIIAINSVHFVPIEKMPSIIDGILDVLKSNGKAFITFNINRIQERSKNKTATDIFEMLKQITNTFDELILVDTFDYTLDNFARENGSFRIILEKK